MEKIEGSNSNNFERSNEKQLVLLKSLSLLFKNRGITWWLSGGYAIEANIGPSSSYRDHSDIDIIIPMSEKDNVVSALRDHNIEFVQELPFLIVIMLNGEKMADLLFYNFNEDGSAILDTEKEIGRNLVYGRAAFPLEPKKYFDMDIPTIRPELMYLQLKNHPNPRDKDKQDLDQLKKIIDPDLVDALDREKPYLTKQDLEMQNTLEGNNPKL